MEEDYKNSKNNLEFFLDNEKWNKNYQSGYLQHIPKTYSLIFITNVRNQYNQENMKVTDVSKGKIIKNYCH